MSNGVVLGLLSQNFWSEAVIIRVVRAYSLLELHLSGKPLTVYYLPAERRKKLVVVRTGIGLLVPSCGRCSHSFRTLLGSKNECALHCHDGTLLQE